MCLACATAALLGASTAAVEAVLGTTLVMLSLLAPELLLGWLAALFV